MEKYLFLSAIFLSSSLLAVPAPPPPSPNREHATPPSPPPQANRVIADVSSLLSGLVIPQSGDPLAHLVGQVESQRGLASLLLGHSRVHSALDNVEHDSREAKRPRQDPQWDLSLDDNDEQPADFQVADENLAIEDLPELDDAFVNNLLNHAELDRILVPNAHVTEARAHNDANRDLISRLPGDLRRLILRDLTPMDRTSMWHACPSFKQYVDDARSKCHLTDTLPVTVIRGHLEHTELLASSYPNVYFSEPASSWKYFSIWLLNIETNQTTFLQNVENMIAADVRAVVTPDFLYFGDMNSFRRMDLKTRKITILSSRPSLLGRPEMILVGDTVLYVTCNGAILFNTRTAELREVSKTVRRALEIDGKPALVLPEHFLIFKDGLKQPPHKVELPEQAIDAVGCGKNICLLTKKGLVLVNKDGVKLSTFAKVKCPKPGRLFPGSKSRCRFKSTKSHEGKLFDALIEWHETHPTVRSYESEGYESCGVLLSGRYLMRANNVEMGLMDMDTGKSIKVFSGFHIISRPIRVGPYIVAAAKSEGPFGKVLIKIDIRGYCSDEDPSMFQ